MTAFDLRGHLTPSGVSVKSVTCRKRIKKDGGGVGSGGQADRERRRGKTCFSKCIMGEKSGHKAQSGGGLHQMKRNRGLTQAAANETSKHPKLCE